MTNITPDVDKILDKLDLQKLNLKVIDETSNDQKEKYKDKIIEDLEIRIKKEMVKCFDPHLNFNKLLRKKLIMQYYENLDDHKKFDELK